MIKNSFFLDNKIISEFFEARINKIKYDLTAIHNSLKDPNFLTYQVEILIEKVIIIVKKIRKLYVLWILEKPICDHLLSILLTRDIEIKIENYFISDNFSNNKIIIDYCTRYPNSIKNLCYYNNQINEFESFTHFKTFSFQNDEEKINYFFKLFDCLKNIFSLNSISLKTIIFYTNEIFYFNYIEDLIDSLLILENFKNRKNEVLELTKLIPLYRLYDKPKETFIIELS